MKKIFLMAIVFLTCICIFFDKAYTEQNRVDVSWRNPTQIKTYIPPNHKNTELMKEACGRWSKMTHDGIIFRYEKTPLNAQVRVTFVERMPSELHMDSAAGITRYMYTTGDRKFRSAEIIIADYSKYGKLTEDEVFTAMLHELGHAIGLNHSNNPESIMYPTTKHVKTMEISKEDLDILAKKYHWR